MNKAQLDAKAVEQEMKQWKTAFSGQGLTVEDVKEAETAIICFTQQETFQSEIETLMSGGVGVKKDSTVYKLDPVLQDGLLRVDGRLRKAVMPESRKHPVILPKGHHVSALILRDLHCQLGHAGRNHILSNLRRLILNANAAARKIVAPSVGAKEENLWRKKWQTCLLKESLLIFLHFLMLALTTLVL